MPHNPTIRFLLANAEHARWVQRGEDGFQTLGAFDAGHKAAASHPRRTVHESAGHGRHAADEVDLAERQRHDFAGVLAEAINDDARHDRFHRLALVAPPRMLGAIRPLLSQDATARLVREIDKDLTKIPDHDLDAWLRAPDLA